MDGATTVIDIVAQVTDDTASGTKSAEKNVTKLEKSISNLYKKIGSMKGKSKLEVKAELKDMASKGIKTIVNAGKKIAGKVWNVTVKMTDMVTAPLKKIWDLASNPITQMVTFTGISVGAADTMNTFKDFEQGMANVKAISGATDADFQRLTQTAKDLGESTRYSASEAAGAMENLAMAGWEPQSIIEGMPGLLDLAAAGSVDLATASDVVASALAQFGYEADQSSRVADVLAATASSSKTDVEGLGESLKYAGPLAGALGYSIEDVSLAFGLMGNSAIDASSAGTALRGMLARMAKQGELTEEESTAVAEAMKKVGVSMTDSQGKSKSLMTIMKDLRSGFSKLTEAEKTEVAANLAGQNAMSGLLAIVNASDEDFNKLTNAITNSKDAAQEMAGTKMDTLEGSILYLQSAVEGVQISLGERISPYFRGIVDALTGQMPAIQDALTGIMDWVDAKLNAAKNTIKTFTNSDEWKNAGLGGKINIAWDNLIATPFKKWFNTKGKEAFLGTIGGIFSEAGKILPGGEEAGLSSWLSAATIVKVANPVINGVKGITDALSSIHPVAGTVALAATAIAGSIAAIGAVIDNYNQKQLSNNLETHFGTIELSAQQAQEAAKGILDIKYLVNVEMALGEIKEADKLREDAQKALDNNDPLEWKSSVGIQLTPEETTEYKTNIETFINNEIAELENRTFAAHISVLTFFGQSEEGQKLDESIQSWARADTLELDGLASDLTAAVDKAISDGIIDVEEEKHISELQSKITGITSRWKQAESQAELDWINQNYGNLSGEDLTYDSFNEVVSALGNQRGMAASETEALMKEFYTMVNAADTAGRLGPRNGLLTADEYKALAGQAARNQEAEDLMTSLEFETNTLTGTYGSKLEESKQKVRESVEKAMEIAHTESEAGEFGKWALTMAQDADSVSAGNGQGKFLFWDVTKDEDQNALNSVWQSMKPDADAMAGLIDEYVNMGQDVPKQVMDKFTEVMEMGAAAGDTDAAWQIYANAIAQSGDKALIDAINQMDAENGLGDEFGKAWRRATQSVTDEPLTLEGLQTEIDGVDMTFNKDEWTEKLHQIEENLSEGDLGTISAETEADITVKVDQGDCLSVIGEAVGVDWHKIAEYNGIEDPYTIYPEMELKIPKESIMMDTSEVETAMTEAVSALSAEGTGLEVTTEGVKVTLGDVQVDPAQTLANISAAVGTSVEALQGAGISEASITAGATITIPQELVTVDSSGLTAAIQASASVSDGGSVGTIQGNATVGVEAASVDPEPAYTAAQTQTQETFNNTMETEGNTNVTMTQTNNAAEIYNQTSSDVKSAYLTPISASATVNVTLNWNLLNPHKTISVTGSGSGSGNLNAALSAEGRYVNSPILSVVGEDGPEFIVPVGAKHRERGLELWEQAGKALGVIAYAEGGAASADEIPEPIFESGENGSGSAGGAAPVVVENINFEVNIDGAGGQDPQALVDTIRENVRGMTDDIAYQLSVAMKQAYSNTPNQAWGA